MKTEFLTWLAKIILSGYYNELNKLNGTDDDYVEDEVLILVETTKFWLANDQPEASEIEILSFMYDNRRV